MRTAGKLIGGLAVVAAGVIGSAAGASAGPSPEVLCERIGGGEIMVGTTASVVWGCEMTHAPDGGTERLLRVAEKSKMCEAGSLIEYGYDLGPLFGGPRSFAVCLSV